MRRSLLVFALSLAIFSCGKEAQRKVIFVGLDGADWQLLDGYMASGAMPNLAALAREGRTGTLTTIHPPLSPLVWTTMMTGVSPLEHGVLDFTRRNPETGTIEPITTAERRVPAVWTMATERGKSVAVFGLWATWPAEPVQGLLVADRFSSFTARDEQPPPGIVHPADREPWAREGLARAEREVDRAALEVYLPGLGEEEYGRALAAPSPYAHPVSALRRILVETRAYHGLATSWIRQEKPDLAIVYFQGTDTIGHLFAPFAPPRQPSISPEDFARYSAVPESYFAEIDRLLGEYRKLAEDEGAVLMIASDHGFLWKEGRPERLASAEAATAGRWHRDEGIYLLWGPGIEASQERATGKVDQVCATLLSLLGLPPGQGLAAPPLPGAPALQGEPVRYAAAPRPTPEKVDAKSAEEEVAKLRALGYLGSREPAKLAPGDVRTPGSYNNEGLLLREAGRPREAEKAFERALAADPNNASALWNLSDLLASEKKDPDRVDDLLVRAASAGLLEGAEHAIARAVAYDQAGETARSVALLDRLVAAQPEDARLWLQRGRYRLKSQHCREALADFERSRSLDDGNALIHDSLGMARLCLGDPEGAARDFRRALEIDPEQPEVRRMLAELGG
ncbi:MAG TPA: alkaline phosphatase family protein [Thermoanaerobaculia bacterium]|nr:alkaline phosphatase family protein [Thermoanaerobaculia bacterium]